MEIFTARRMNGMSAVFDNYAYLHTIYAWGNFDGATILLQGSPNAAIWFDLMTCCRKDARPLHINTRYLRACLRHAGPSTNLYLRVE